MSTSEGASPRWNEKSLSGVGVGGGGVVVYDDRSKSGKKKISRDRRLEMEELKRQLVALALN